jgi:CAAX protease family protein
VNGRPSPNTGGAVIRWGIGDFLWVYLAGLATGLVLGTIGAGIEGTQPDNKAGALAIALSAIGQFAGWIGFAALVSNLKGRGALSKDFGFRIDVRDWWFAAVGVAVYLAANAALLLPKIFVDESQEIVNEVKSASGAKLVALSLVALFLAPLGEELLFRGLLQRSLRRRMPVWGAIALQALVFALSHPLLSPTLGDFLGVPAFFALGVVGGAADEMKGDISPSIFMHFGFNALGLFFILASR